MNIVYSVSFEVFLESEVLSIYIDTKEVPD